MKKRSVLLGVFVGIPFVLLTLFLIVVGYCATQPEFYIEIGRQFHTGEEVAKNDNLAVWCYRKAANMGNATAQTCLGYCYDNGIGISQDSTEALVWFQKSAEQGCLDAYLSLETIFVIKRVMN